MKYILDLDKTIIASIEEANQAFKEGDISKMTSIYKEVIPLAAQGIAETVFEKQLEDVFHFNLVKPTLH